jgi:transposase
MRDREFQAKILGIERPWVVDDVVVTMQPKTVETHVSYDGPASCPVCGKVVPKYDVRERRWRHLDIYEFEAYVIAQVPRAQCPDDGVRQIKVPWADGRSGFTALFEHLAISLLQEMSIAAVARIMRLTWDEIDGIMQRAISRSLALRKDRIVKHLGIDEKSFKKRHKYVTIVTDLDAREVIWVGSGRKRETLDAFWKTLSPEQLAGIKGVAIDMWPAYIESTLAFLPDAEEKIVFDKFHVMKYLTHAVDLERRAAGRSDSTLKKTRYQWLRRPGNMSHSERIEFAKLRKEHERLGRAWAIKETFANLWDYRYVGAARNFFREWYSWAIRSRFRHMKDVARLIARHIENILTYLRIPITNAASESVNSKIQWFKYQARGFRNEARFIRAILFHCGALDLCPTHTSS